MANKLTVELTGEIRDLKAKLDAASKLVEDFGKKQDDYFSKREKQGKGEVSLNSQVASSIKGLIGAYVGLQAAVAAVGKAFSTALQLESVKSALNFVLGSTDATAQAMEMLSEKADHLGIDLLSLTKAYKSFTGAALQANVTLEESNAIFNSISQAASVMRLSSEQLEGALNAVQQMISKGNVQAEELRGQLAERLPGAFALAAKAMGVTQKELNKLLEGGQVLASDLLPKLAIELEKTFGGQTAMRADNLNASVARLNNTFTNAVEKGGIGKIFKAFVDMANVSIEVVESFYKISKNTDLMTTLFNQGTKSIGELTAEFDKIAEMAKTTEQVANGTKQYDFTMQELTRTVEDQAARIKELKKQYEGYKEASMLRPATFDYYRTLFDREKALLAAIQKRIAAMQKGSSGPTGEKLSLIPGAKDLDQEAKALLQVFKEYPNALNALGEAYTKNPLFRQLLNNELQTKALELRDSLVAVGQAQYTVAADPQMEAYIANWKLAVDLIGTTLAQSFESAISGGEDFFKALLNGLKQLIIKLIAAASAALVLNALLAGTPLIGGGVYGGLSGFGSIFKGLSGFDTGTSNRVAPAPIVGSNMSGAVEFVIRGDVLYGVLQSNATLRNRLS